MAAVADRLTTVTTAVCQTNDFLVIDYELIEQLLGDLGGELAMVRQKLVELRDEQWTPLAAPNGRLR